MTQVLIPVDPTHAERTRSAIEEVVRLAQEEPVTVRLLRVQPRVTSHVAMFFDNAELHALQRDAGKEDLAFAERLLDVAGVSYTSLVRVGRSAETIVATARETGCDRIMFGTERAGLASRVFGSVAQQVRQMLGSAGDLTVLGS
jgi:nucleotide-binding universal stress UspA family protein